METDKQLLAAYSEQGSEKAFRELVERHINMVHSAALRESSGDVSQAEDITQGVFTELARRATKLNAHPALAGWLYTCVRLMAANIRHSEAKRQRREQEAVVMNQILNDTDTERLWQQVQPVLDDAMHELDDEDRSAVVMRYFEGLSHKEVGAALGLSENAARMRVERSLEKLHGALSRRGINSTAATLAAGLVVAAGASTSSAFAATVAANAMGSAAAAAGGSSLAAVAKAFSTTKAKTAVTGVAAVVIGGLLVLAHYVKSGESVSSSAGASTSSILLAVPSSQNMTATAATKTNNASAPQMSLHLVEDESGAALAGAKLHLFYLLADGRGKVVNATTDSKGELGVDFPQPPYRGLNMFVAADGHVPKVIGWGFRTPMLGDYTMRLQRGLTIGGTIVDQGGRPVSRAKIEFASPGSDLSKLENIAFGPDASAHSDASGHWSFNMIPKDWERVSFTVRHPQHAETNISVQTQSPDSQELLITMARGFTVAGKVLDTNSIPISGAKIRQVRLSGKNEHSTKSDASGTFELKSLTEGELMLAVQAEGFAPAVQTLQITNDISTVLFQLGPGHLLLGRVVDETGHPVTNAFVETTRRGIDKVRWSTNTDADGRFSWDSAPSEPLLYSVLAEGFARAYAQSLAADGTEHELKLGSAAKESFQVTGNVVDADTGAALDAFKVSISELDADWAFPLEYYTQGHNGTFTLPMTFKSSHPGYEVVIEKEGYLPGISAKLFNTNGSQRLAFALRKGTGPSGTVSLPTGDLAAGATVCLCTPLAGVTLSGPASIQPGLNTTTYRTQTDPSGSFSLPAALNPQGLVIVHQNGFAQLSLNGLAPGSSITLQPWGRIEGTVTMDSQPATNVQVVIAGHYERFAADGRQFGFLRFSQDTTTDAHGAFSFEKVPPGECRVFLRKSISTTSFVSSHAVELMVEAGKTTRATMGGNGCTLIGKVLSSNPSASIDWSRVAVRLSSAPEPRSRPQRKDFPTVQAFVNATDQFFRNADAIKRFGAFCDADGSFRVADVPAGNYELKIEIHDSKKDSAAPHDAPDPDPVLYSLTRQVEVPDSQSSEPVDLGQLELLPAQNTASTQ
jgi:RNA polymerase sigma factor (sigma-70 family)